MASPRLQQPPPTETENVGSDAGGVRHSIEIQVIEPENPQPSTLSTFIGERPRSKSLLSSGAGGGRKRAGSGNFMSRLSFFRAGLSENHAQNLKPPPSPEHVPAADGADDVEEQEKTAFTKRGGSAMANALEEQQQHKGGRKRTGSLRKAALLGTSMLRRASNTSTSSASAAEGGAAHVKEKDKQQQQQQQQQQQSQQKQDPFKSSKSPQKDKSKNRSKNSKPTQTHNPVYPSIASLTEPKSSITSLSSVGSSTTSASNANSAATAAAASSSNGAYASTTTSEEDFTSVDGSSLANGSGGGRLSLHIPQKPSNVVAVLSTSASANAAAVLSRTSTISQHSPPSSVSESPITSAAAAVAATAASSPMRHRVRSPLGIVSADTTTPITTATAAAPATAAVAVVDEGWDYSETAWWGWVVLIATWIVFVVGMGSCLEVWSWAWDVGETPYAPPELENDPTLPIVGYYPALMVLTGVMSWVWVVVAWVGMKYFKHAKIQTDDADE